MNDVTIFVVLRSPVGRHEIVEKGTHEYRLATSNGSVTACEGSSEKCQAYQTPGMIFKEKYGVSKTVSRLIDRYNRENGTVIGLEDWKRKRKERKKKQKAEGRAKHDRAIAARKAKAASKVKPAKK